MTCKCLEKEKCPFCGETKNIKEENRFLMKCNKCGANWGCSDWPYVGKKYTCAKCGILTTEAWKDPVTGKSYCFKHNEHQI